MQMKIVKKILISDEKEKNVWQREIEKSVEIKVLKEYKKNRWMN